MPPLPPAQLVLEAMQQTVLPAAAGAAFMLCLVLTLGRRMLAVGLAIATVVAGFFRPKRTIDKPGWEVLGERVFAIGAAIAVVFGFIWANSTFDKTPWENKGALVLDKAAWGVKTYRLLPWSAEPETKSAWERLPRVALILIAVGLTSRWIGSITARYLPERHWWGANLLVWAPRFTVVFVVSGWLVSERALAESPWLQLILRATMLLTWLTLDSLAHAREDGEIAAHLAAIFMAAGIVMLYAHSAKFMEIAVVLGSATFGIAIVATAAKADVSGAIPAGVAFLPGLVLAARPSLAENNVPGASFWLVAFAPLVLAPFLIPALARRDGQLTRTIRFVLVLIPLIVAVMLAAEHEKLVFEEDY